MNIAFLGLIQHATVVADDCSPTPSVRANECSLTLSARADECPLAPSDPQEQTNAPKMPPQCHEVLFFLKPIASLTTAP
ncbi:hypothetical protein BKA81DRAFT_26964 [Phyllosticta paracitricarpa]